MYTYLLINLAIISIPLAFSFEKRIQYYTKWKYLLFAIMTAGLGYIAWDAWVTEIGHWSFSPDYTTGWKLFGLPIEEILFFITVPYSCLFIYEALKFKLKDNQIKINRHVWLSIFAIMTIVALLNFSQGYTRNVFLATGLYFLGLFLWPNKNTMTLAYYIFMLICFIPFFAVNYILTSLPIVTYGADFFSNIRITTIPAEDFIYSLGMLGWYSLAYFAGQKIFSHKKLY